MWILLFRQNVSLPSNEEAEELNEAESLQTSSCSDVSTDVHSEQDTGMNADRLQSTDHSDNVLIEVDDSTALAVSDALQHTDQQFNCSAAEGTDFANISCPNTSSTDQNNVQSSEQQFPRSSTDDGSVSEASVNNGDGDHTNLSTESAAVSAELRVGKTLSGATQQALVPLHPKPTYTLLPLRVEVPLFVLVNTSTSTSRRSVRLPTIAPRLVDVTASDACLPAVLQVDSSLTHGDSLQRDMSMASEQPTSSVVTQTAAAAKRKTVAAATQTSDWLTSATRLTKVSKASQVLCVPSILVIHV